MNKAGKWLDAELKAEKVWLVLMPAAQFDTPLIAGLDRHPDWRVVFLNNKQEILVDTKSPMGRDVFEKMLQGKLYYPDEFSKELTLAHNLLPVNNSQAQQAGLESAVKAFNLQPSQLPLLELFGVARSPDFLAKVDGLIKTYMIDFEKNKDNWLKQDGFNNKVVAAIIGATYLQKTDDNADIAQLGSKLEQYKVLQRDLLDASRW
jgi:hypothetical protein